jgi:cysteine-rich repeat protein
VLDPGEECDDRNLLNGDGCSATCTSELISGGGSSKIDCTQEWLTNPVPLRRDGGLPKARLECVDDDPTCDFGGRTGDKACTFHIALCFKVTEVRFACKPTDVARVELREPEEDDPRGPAETANRDALEAALAGLGGMVRGQCMSPRPGPDVLCAADSDCRSKLGKQSECRGRFVVFDPPLATADTCTEFASVVVPLKQTGRELKSSKTTLKLAVTPANSESRGTDTDSLQLICQPQR